MAFGYILAILSPPPAQKKWFNNFTIQAYNLTGTYLLSESFLFARLSHEWQAYISRTHKLRKTFVSVKGIYYQVLLLIVQYCCIPVSHLKIIFVYSC